MCCRLPVSYFAANNIAADGKHRISTESKRDPSGRSSDRTGSAYETWGIHISVGIVTLKMVQTVPSYDGSLLIRFLFG